MALLCAINRNILETQKFYYFLAGKLNALDDWRNARMELTKKFEIQEEEIAKQNEYHARTLYQARKSLVIEKSKCVLHILYSVLNLQRILPILFFVRDYYL